MFSKIFAAYRKAYTGLPQEIWLLSFTIFVNRLGTMVLPFLSIYLTKSQGYSNSSAALIVSIYGSGAVVGAFMGGQLTSRVGAIRLQIILLLLSAPVFLLIPNCDSFFQLAGSIFLLSILSEGVRPANGTALTEFSNPDQRSQAFALNRMALNLGIAFGPVIGGLLITIDYYWIFVSDAVTTAACAVLLGSFFGFNSSVSTDKEQPIDFTQKSSSSPWMDFEFLAYLGLTFLSAAVFFQIFTTYPLYLTQFYHLSEFNIGMLFAVNNIMIVLFEMIFVDHARRWNLVLVVGWGNFLACLGFGILPFGSTIVFGVVSMVVLTMGEIMASPMSASWVSQRSERGDTGEYMGLYTMAYAIAFIVGPAAGGLIYEYEPALVFYVCLALAVLVLLGFYSLNARIEKPKSTLLQQANEA